MKRGQEPQTDQPLSELRQLSRLSPPPALVAKVMQEVDRPRGFQLWNWLCQPRQIELRLSPLALLCTTLILGVGLWAVQNVPPKPASTMFSDAKPAHKDETQADVVLVRFVLHAQGAHTVALAGDFNGWNHEATPLQVQPHNNVFAVTLPLRRGQAYQYMFWVDGQWVADPGAELRPDGFGQQNSVLRL